MRHAHVLFALVIGGLIVAGCAGPRSGQPSISGPAPAASMSAADKVFFYRQQASELRQMAERLELEANWYAKQAGTAGSEEAKQREAMAKNLRSAADDADQQASSYRQQVPHNQVN